jgi:hypothetical protein
MRVAVKFRSGAPQAQDLTVIRVARAQVDIERFWRATICIE